MSVNLFHRSLWVLALSAIWVLNAAFADEVSRPDSHAPIGVMGDHRHTAGEVMFSYRFMTMSMEGSRDGTGSIGDSDVLQDFMVTPTQMTTDMHMFGAMYAPSDRITLMAMAPYVEKSMDHLTRMGGQFNTESDGIGDVKLSAMIGFGADTHVSIGISAPTGDIDAEDVTPMGRVRLPYPMQLGSGTWDLMLGATHVRQRNAWSWGGQVNGVLRAGENDNDYRLGNEFGGSLWSSRTFSEAVSGSLRLIAKTKNNIVGADPLLNPLLVPTADPSRRGGTRLDLAAGVNLIGTGGFVKNHRLALEISAPVYEDLDGPQLESDWMLMAGWQYALPGR